ncbi:hypothetical protein, partial [Paenibacillus piri]|uniref:hypothetical protein n=1 Tax=Paenibacillus piri TaxID=2547395 RepID=UPI001C6FEC8B
GVKRGETKPCGRGNRGFLQVKVGLSDRPDRLEWKEEGFASPTSVPRPSGCGTGSATPTSPIK